MSQSTCCKACQRAVSDKAGSDEQHLGASLRCNFHSALALIVGLQHLPAGSMHLFALIQCLQAADEAFFDTSSSNRNISPYRPPHSISKANFFTSYTKIQLVCLASCTTSLFPFVLLRSIMVALPPIPTSGLLPDEMVIRICELLESQQDLYSLMRVGRKFYDIAEQILYNYITVRDDIHPHKLLTAFEKKPLRATWVKCLSFRYTLDYTSDECCSNKYQIARILHALPKSRELDITLPDSSAMEVPDTTLDQLRSNLSEHQLDFVFQCNAHVTVPSVLTSPQDCTLRFGHCNQEMALLYYEWIFHSSSLLSLTLEGYHFSHGTIRKPLACFIGRPWRTSAWSTAITVLTLSLNC